jgi:hypothetical protein
LANIIKLKCSFSNTKMIALCSITRDPVLPTTASRVRANQ